MTPRDERVESDPRPMPAEFQYLLVVVAIFALLLLAGVPGREEESVGDGSQALKKGWAARHTERVQAEAAAKALPAEPAPER